MEREIKDMRIRDFFSGEDSVLIDLSISVVCRETSMRLFWAKPGKPGQTFSASPDTMLEFFVDSIRSYYREHPNNRLGLPDRCISNWEMPQQSSH